MGSNPELHILKAPLNPFSIPDSNAANCKTVPYTCLCGSVQLDILCKNMSSVAKIWQVLQNFLVMRVCQCVRRWVFTQGRCWLSCNITSRSIDLALSLDGLALLSAAVLILVISYPHRQPYHCDHQHRIQPHDPPLSQLLPSLPSFNPHLSSLSPLHLLPLTSPPTPSPPRRSRHRCWASILSRTC